MTYNVLLVVINIAETEILTTVSDKNSCSWRFGHHILYTNIEGTRRPQSVPTILTETIVSSFCTAWRRLAAILEHTDLLQCSTVKAWSLVKWRSLIRFCLDHSRARNERAIRKQLKQTCRRTKQSKEKRLKHKVSGYKSLSKRRSIAGCRLLLRTLAKQMQLSLIFGIAVGS